MAILIATHLKKHIMADLAIAATKKYQDYSSSLAKEMKGSMQIILISSQFNFINMTKLTKPLS